MAKSEEFLKAAFAGESQTNRRYLAFALQAEQEGQSQVARLFRAAAEAETVHAHNYLKALRGVRGTRENLQEAISVESRAFKSIIPEMVETARAEGNKEAEDFFRYALETEKVHADLFQKAADALGHLRRKCFLLCLPGVRPHSGETPPSTCPILASKTRGTKKLSSRILVPVGKAETFPVELATSHQENLATDSVGVYGFDFRVYHLLLF